MSKKIVESIIEEIINKPGQKAKEIARTLNVDKKDVNQVLYGTLKDKAWHDVEYRWYLEGDAGSESAQQQDTSDRDAASTAHISNPDEPETSSKDVNNSMPEMICPKCNSSMVLRTAKKGKFAGRQFWGCSNYPSCKQIVDYDQGQNSQDVENDPTQEGFEQSAKTSPNTSSSIVISRRFEAKSPDALQTFFFESVALPKPAFDSIQADRLNEIDIRNFAQWRLDFNPGTAIPNRTPLEDQVVSVLEKILTRGRITLISPELEKKILDGSDNGVNLSHIHSIHFPSLNYLSDELFDSEEEKIFFTEWVPSILGSGCYKYIIPQVSISSLLPLLREGISGRVDFLLSHPTLSQSVVLEIDGTQHANTVVEDRTRDEALMSAGYDVIRIPASEVRSGEGGSLNRVSDLLHQIQDGENGLNREWNLLNETRICHQIQLCLTTALKAGLLRPSMDVSPKVTTDLSGLKVLSGAKAKSLVQKAVDDFSQLVKQLCKLHGVKGSTDKEETLNNTDINIYFSLRSDQSERAFHIQDIYLPFSLSRNVSASPPQYLSKVDEEDLLYFLKYCFRKNEFWEGQFEAASRILANQDTILLLPTGAGKSIAFQLAGLVLPGVAIVVDPILSLIDDQIENLRSVGIERCVGISSQIDDPSLKEEVIDIFSQGEFLFTYIAPERFQIEGFRGAIKALTTSTPISLIAVDEAHCVSEWGHDFRTAYLNLGRVSRELCKMDGSTPPLIALTGTASRSVLKDVQRELEIPDFEAIITPETFDREELHFEIKFCKTAEKRDVLKGVLRQVLPSKFGTSISTFFQSKSASTYSGLLFCPHVNGDHGVRSISKFLREDLKIDADFYSGSPPRGMDYKTYNYRKQDVARKFKRDEIPLLVATKAFGMGIDKPNIRYTIHYNLPPSIESFYQECGRAGRDRQDSQCVLIISDDYPEKNRKLLHVDTPVNEIIKSKAEKGESDDIDRNLWFQTNSFPGVDKEMENLKDTISRLNNLRERSTQTVGFEDRQSMRISEKAIHRLVVLGVVEDYLINFAANTITVTLSRSGRDEIINAYFRYVSGYSEKRAGVERELVSNIPDDGSDKFVLAVAEKLLGFLYDVIERGRRRAMEEMLDAAKTGTNDALRSRILQYLEQTEFSPIIERLLDEEADAIDAVHDVFDLVVSPQKASELRGQAARFLESYPDNPGLLIMRGLSEYRCRDRDSETVITNIVAAVRFAKMEYGMDDLEVANLLIWTIGKFDESDAELVQALLLNLFESESEGSPPDKHTLIVSRPFTRKLIHNLQIEFCSLPARYLMGQVFAKYKQISHGRGEEK